MAASSPSGWAREGPAGIYRLLALDVEPAIDDMDLDTWRELNRVRVKICTPPRASTAVNALGTFRWWHAAGRAAWLRASSCC
ncbi:MAG: hypothetical protein H6661_03970 [Ardenticatenaceae bacterium]|nr:hypothetical protein [Ardenticatenaceae bacterium]